jgi:hypothetical protein
MLVSRIRRLVALGGAAVVVAGVCLPLATGEAGAVTASTPKFNKSAALSFIRASLRDVKVGSPIHGVHEALSGDIKATAVTSSNWSGYAALSTGTKTYTAVHGQFKEPKITCPTNVSGTSLAAFWVGIDGFSSQTVEQDGTIAECSGSTLLGYADWWEMYPTNAVNIVNVVSAGDTIIASVVDAGGNYTLKVTDKTNTSASFSTTQTCGTTACANSSAEWIAEAPCCVGSSVYPLAKFTEWRVINGRATSGGKSAAISKYTHDSITMDDSSSKVMAKPTALSTTGTSFGDIWHASS